MRYIKTFEDYKGSKIYFYDKDGKWFSSSKYIKSIEEHKERFGDDITFSVDGIDIRFNTVEEYLNYIKKADKSGPSSIFNTEDDIQAAKNRVKQKRELNKTKKWF